MNSVSRKNLNDRTCFFGTNSNVLTLHSIRFASIFAWQLKWWTTCFVGSVTTKHFLHIIVRTKVECAWATLSALRKRPPSILRTSRVIFYRKKREATKTKGIRKSPLLSASINLTPLTLVLIDP